MNKYLALFFILFSVLMTSCTKEEDKAVVTTYVPTYRWMDREIYFAFSSGTNPQRNNEFQKVRVQEAFKEIENISSLGEGYFNFKEVDEAVLQPIYNPEQSASEYRSFVLIWPDADFNDFVVNTLGGNVPDNNAVTVINSAFKRKFYMIIKASCFVSSSACNEITQNGLRALIARQIGSLTGMIIRQDCGSDPENTLCASLPNNEQWNDFNKLRWSNSFNNTLETILNNPNFYDEYVPE